MPTFALEKIKSIKGYQSFEKLIIDGNCQLDDFEIEVEKDRRNSAELGTLYRYMELLADGTTLPKEHFKDITPDGQTVKEYEFKSKHLRIYAIKKENGKVIILGGYKNRQKRDLKKFRKTKREYLESIKQHHGKRPAFEK